jgi:hypothetical protein
MVIVRLQSRANYVAYQHTAFEHRHILLATCFKMIDWEKNPWILNLRVA